MRIRLFLSFVFCCLCCVSLCAAEPSWPVFHGLSGDNISKETGLLKSWPEDGPPLLWKSDVLGTTEFPGYSSVTIMDGRLVTTGNVITGDQTHVFVFALDANTGKKLWDYDNGPAWTGHFPGDRSTPTLDGDRVYAFSAMGRLTCLNAKDGKEIWTRDIKADANADLPTWAFAESVVIDGDKVVCWPGGKKAAVMALDKMTGKTIWETPGSDEKAAYSTMIIFEQDGVRIYANMNQKGVLGVRAKDGKQLFSHPHPTSYDVNATMPYYSDGKLLISSGYGTTGTQLLKLTISGDAGTLEPIWVKQPLDNQHGGLIVLDGFIYGAANKYKGGSWLCLDEKNGDIKWESRAINQGSISCADNMLYLYGEKDGVVALVKPDSEKYEEVSKFTLPEGGAGNYWAHPVICGGKLYLRHAPYLYCFDVKAK
ncbi:MAG: PQQ-binding-like beta-propeller repeat protein [Thermoguttaceae bacterium]